MKTLEPLINQLVKMIQEGYNLAKNQLPDVVQQILAFETVKAYFDIAYIIVFSIASISTLFVGLKYVSRDKYDSGVIGPTLVCSGGVGTITSVVLLIGVLPKTIETLLKIHYAPKLFLIEYLKAIVN